MANASPDVFMSGYDIYPSIGDSDSVDGHPVSPSASSATLGGMPRSPSRAQTPRTWIEKRTPGISRPPAWLLATFAVFLLALGVFVLPYHVAVLPSVSQSYATGFSNRAAVVSFLIGSSLLAFSTNGILPRPQARDRKLPQWTFWITVGFTLFACGGWCFQRAHRGLGLGTETMYAIERQTHLDRGEMLYGTFEYAYGPLLIYPGHWLHRAGAGHSAIVHGYLLSWTLAWAVGAAMLWFVVARLDFPTRYRAPLLVYLLAVGLEAIPCEGMNYSPLRTYCAAFGCVACYAVWQYRRPYVFAVSTVAAIALGFAVSPEQGFGLLFGLGAFAVLLAWRERRIFPAVAALLAISGGLGVAAIAFFLGALRTARAFASGGYNFPLLASPTNLFILATYVCGIGFLFREFRSGRLESVVLPLGLCGVPILFSAMGRCDVGHLMSATPLYLAGVIAIAGRPRVFFVWLPLACYFFLDLGHVINFAAAHAHASSAPRGDSLQSAAPNAIDEPIAAKADYFAPVSVPMGGDGLPRWDAQSGYYSGLWNVISAEDVQRKRDEINQRRAPLLVLPDEGGKVPVRFFSTETDPEALKSLEASAWRPRAIHALPSTAPIAQVIEMLYTPTRQAENNWRVWRLR